MPQVVATYMAPCAGNVAHIRGTATLVTKRAHIQGPPLPEVPEC